MESNKKISDLKFKILVDAISAIDISEVDVKFPEENNVILYIKTKNLKSVNSDKLKEICGKFSDDEFLVTYQIPTGKFIDNKEVENTDLICIFIEK